MDFISLIDLASARVGGKAVETNDEFFAPKENLLKPAKAVWIADKYTTKGKWMDGWESRRRRTPGYDWCVIKLGLRGVIRGVNVDTSFFTGNFPSHASLDARDGKGPWVEILPKTELKGNGDNIIPVKTDKPYDHVRLNIFPDGGVARLRVYGEVSPNWAKIPKKALVDLIAVENGGLPLLASDVHYSHPQNLIMPGRSKNMGDGWETKRRRGPGSDWAILKLGAPGQIHKIEVDTNFFKGNYPDSCMIEGVHKPAGTGAELADEFTPWVTVLPQAKLSAHKRRFFQKEIVPHGPITHVRLNIYPDGGVSRLRLFGVRAALVFALAAAAPGAARAAGLLPVKACVKWSKEIPEAQAAGTGLFAGVARVEGKGPFPACDVVVETDSFGVGWLMRAWMKEGVYSSCGERLGGFKFTYKGEEWQAKTVSGLHEFLSKNPKALTEAKPCAPNAAPPPAPAAAVEISTGTP